MRELSTKIGERNPEHPWELASAADYVAGSFEALGYPVERVGYEVSGVVAQNLAVTIRGSEAPNEVWVLGAHYDSARGERGEDRNATGVAALLELARMMRDAKCARTLRLVAFAVSEPPFAGTGDMGSVRFLGKAEATDKVVGMISLDGIGALGDQDVSEGPAHVRLTHLPGAEALAGRVRSELEGDPLTFQVAVEPSPGSDHWAFAQRQIPAVWVGAAGASHRVDYDGMTRLVMRLRFALADFVGESLTNDGMLTPGSDLVR